MSDTHESAMSAQEQAELARLFEKLRGDNAPPLGPVTDAEEEREQRRSIEAEAWANIRAIDEMNGPRPKETSYHPQKLHIEEETKK